MSETNRVVQSSGRIDQLEVGSVEARIVNYQMMLQFNGGTRSQLAIAKRRLNELKAERGAR